MHSNSPFLPAIFLIFLQTALEQELASSKALQRALQAEVKAARVELEEAAEVLRAREEKIACLKEQLEVSPERERH